MDRKESWNFAKIAHEYLEIKALLSLINLDIDCSS